MLQLCEAHVAGTLKCYETQLPARSAEQARMQREGAVCMTSALHTYQGRLGLWRPLHHFCEEARCVVAEAPEENIRVECKDLEVCVCVVCACVYRCGLRCGRTLSLAALKTCPREVD